MRRSARLSTGTTAAQGPAQSGDGGETARGGGGGGPSASSGTAGGDAAAAGPGKKRKSRASAGRDAEEAAGASDHAAAASLAHDGKTESGDELPPWDAVDDSEDEKVVKKKKAKKAVGSSASKQKTARKGKVASWTDLAEPSTVSLQQFPIEIWDHIVSVDADLGLRDHLALAGTCRWMRACYTDLVWQVLFYAHCPGSIMDADEVIVFHTTDRGGADATEVSSYVGERGTTYWPVQGRVGPFARSFGTARRIFSSGTDGAPGALRAISVNDRLPRTYDLLEDLMVIAEDVYERILVRDDLTDAEARRWRNMDRTDNFLASIKLDALFARIEYLCAQYDPWPSTWRSVVAMAVNRPTLTKTGARKFYRITDRELAALTKVEAAKGYVRRGVPTQGGYRLATLEALALRSHGGPAGHKAHLKKLEATRLKGEATRSKNKKAKEEKWAAAAETGDGASTQEQAEAQAMDVGGDWASEQEQNEAMGIMLAEA